MKRNITLWTVQWIESDDCGELIPKVEIHLTYESAKSRVALLSEASELSFEEIIGYPTNLASEVSMSKHEI